MPTMSLSPSASRRVYLRLSSQRVPFGRWESVRWSVATLSVDGPPAEPGPSLRLGLQLHPGEATNYRENLRSAQPLLFVVCHATDDDRLDPCQITLSQEEASAHLEADGEVLSTPLPETLCQWAAEYLATLPPEERRPKRRGADG